MSNRTTLFAVAAVLFLFPRIDSHAQNWQFVTTEYLCADSDESGAVILGGRYGHLMRTADGGSTWTLPMAGTYRDILVLLAAGDGRWYAAGDSGLVLTSSDFGSTWSSIDAPTKMALRFLQYDEQKDALRACGEIECLEWSGSQWSRVDSFPFSMVRAATGTDGVFWGLDSIGRLFSQIDRSSPWQRVSVTDDSDSGWAGLFAEGDTVLLGGRNGRYALSVNTGESWEAGSVAGADQFTLTRPIVHAGSTILAGLHERDGLPHFFVRPHNHSTFDSVRLRRISSRTFEFTAAVPLSDSTVALGAFGELYAIHIDGSPSDTIAHVHFDRRGYENVRQISVAGSVGIGIGPSIGGAYIRSDDSGTTWVSDAALGDSQRESMVFHDLYSVLVTNDTRTGVSRDSARTWVLRQSQEVPNVQGARRVVDVDFLDTLTWQSALEISGTGGGVYLATTTDGGDVYRLREVSDWESAGRVSFLTEELGIMSVLNLQNDQAGGLLYTDDGGESWSEIFRRDGLLSAPGVIRLVDSNHILVVVNGSSVGSSAVSVLQESRDRGRTWSTLLETDRGIFDVAVLSDSLWYVVGRNLLLLKSSDAGGSWEPYEFDKAPQYVGEAPRTPLDFLTISLAGDDQTLFIGGLNCLLKGTLDQPVTSVPTYRPFPIRLDLSSRVRP